MISLSSRTCGAAVVIATLLLSVSSAAWAQPAAPERHTPSDPMEAAPPKRRAPAKPKPWVARVPADRQVRALKLYKEGNALYANERYKHALTRYEQALREWDHPGIRYNMVECLVNLGCSLEAYHHLLRAMKYGAAPLGDRIFRQAKTYRNMLLRSLAKLKVRCDEPGARVTLDGKLILVAPGRAIRLLMPGVYTIVAKKAGFVNSVQEPQLSAGREIMVILTLIPQKKDIRYVRRWKRWIPWTVFSAGVALASVALPLYLIAKKDYGAFQSRFSELCDNREPANGCTQQEPEQLDSTIYDLERRAEREYRASVGMLAVGSAVAATGITLLILNRPRAQEQPTRNSTIRLGAVAAPGRGHETLRIEF